MANKHAKDGHDIEICAWILSYLRNFPLFEESHSILARTHEKGTSISYWTKPCQREPDQTKFDIQIDRETCDILGFQIQKSQRQRDYGKALYTVIEKFAKLYRCNRMQTTPSEQDEDFWKAMGFTTPCEAGLEKTLN